jgi:hypothetical protein
MSSQPATAKTALSRTRHAASVALRRRDAALVFVATTVLYLVVYLWMIDHLAPGLGGYGMSVVADPLAKFLQPELGPFMFTPVARVSLGPVTYLVWTQPNACGIGGKSSGFLASIPALLSGTACCGPVVLIVLGIQASGVLLTGFQFLLPAAALLLVGSLVLVGRQVNPQAI